MLTRQDGPRSILVDRAGGPGVLGEDRGGIGERREAGKDVFCFHLRRIHHKEEAHHSKDSPVFPLLSLLQHLYLPPPH